jgi:rubredoxin
MYCGAASELKSRTHEIDGVKDTMAEPMQIWQCQTPNCGYLYDPSRGDKKGMIPKGIAFEELPEDWKCPICGAGKRMFRPLSFPGSATA